MESETLSPARPRWRRFVPLLLLVAGLIAFFAAGLEHQLTLESLRQNRDALERWVDAHPVLSALIFVIAYVAVVACSIPAASPMTLAGGFLFGTFEGGSLVVGAATLGATILFLAAKTALADLFRARLGANLRKMEDGFNANAFNYLLALRLAPVFPFFLVNLAAGLLGVRLWTYVAATFVGIIPATFVYAGLGNGLGALFEHGVRPDLALVFEPRIFLPLLGLAALSLVPVFWQRR
ncbi:MAG TPA: TVP38/TMEM64 family protein [Rhizomicrobium sp.]|nr:TVP38/TMEM64 family protein [Rhizomicrobium sp.]